MLMLAAGNLSKTNPNPPFLDTFTDTAITSTRVNGEHKEKVLQRWEGGDSNGESYDLENDAVSLICLLRTNTS